MLKVYFQSWMVRSSYSYSLLCNCIIYDPITLLYQNITIIDTDRNMEGKGRSEFNLQHTLGPPLNWTPVTILMVSILFTLYCMWITSCSPILTPRTMQGCRGHCLCYITKRAFHYSRHSFQHADSTQRKHGLCTQCTVYSM